MKISLASPVYNNSKNINQFVKVCDSVLKKISPNSYEIVLVNDASTDDTFQKLIFLKSVYKNLKVINLNENQGQHIATTIALKSTKGEYIFVMDSDLQINPEYMQDFYNHLNTNTNFDVISADRKIRSKSLTRRLGSYFVSVILKQITKKSLNDIGSTFKLFTRNSLNRLLKHDILFQNLPILIMNLNLKVYEFKIDYNVNVNTKSNYRFKDLVSALLLALLNFSTGLSTMIFILILGFISFIIGFSTLIGLIIMGVAKQESLPVNLLIFSSILLIVGLLFILMGVLVFKLERINKNLDFRKSLDQYINED